MRPSASEPLPPLLVPSLLLLMGGSVPSSVPPLPLLLMLLLPLLLGLGSWAGLGEGVAAPVPAVTLLSMPHSSRMCSLQAVEGAVGWEDERERRMPAMHVTHLSRHRSSHCTAACAATLQQHAGPTLHLTTHSSASLVWLAANEAVSWSKQPSPTPSTAVQQPLPGPRSAVLPLQARSAGTKACWHAAATSTLLLVTVPPLPPLLSPVLLLLPPMLSPVLLLPPSELGGGRRTLVCTFRLASKLPDGSRTTTVMQAPAPTASAASRNVSTYL